MNTVESPSVIDMAIIILEKTNDGDGLTDGHLYLIQEGVNDNLNEYGIAEIKKIYDQVITTGYQKPAFHGIEGLSKDHNGYVYWKGIRVEHYSFRDFEEEKKAAHELARRARIVESRNQPVCFNSLYPNNWVE